MSTTMLAAVFKAGGSLELEDRPRPSIEHDDDVILQVGAVGLCGTDVHILDVPPRGLARVGVIMGHEFAGRVVEVGEAVRGIFPGDAVTIDPNPPCGSCATCRAGMPNLCEVVFTNPEAPGWPNTPGQWWDGAMAEYVRVPLRYVYKVDPELPPWVASLAEPVACVLNGVNKVNLKPGETAVVLGGGPIGLMFAALLKASGASKVVVAETAPFRLELAKKCGVDVTVNPREQDIRERVREVTQGQGADVVIDTVGSLLPLSVELVASGGRIALFGVDARAEVPVRPLDIVARELQVMGVFITRYTMSDAIRVLQSGLLPVNEIVTHRLPLEQVQYGLDLARRGEAGKVIFEPSVRQDP